MHDGGCPEGLAEAGYLFGDGVEGLVPAYPLPAALHLLLGEKHAVRAVNPLCVVVALSAEESLCEAV